MQARQTDEKKKSRSGGRHHKFHRRIRTKDINQALRKMKLEKIFGSNDVPIEM